MPGEQGYYQLIPTYHDRSLTISPFILYPPRHSFKRPRSTRQYNRQSRRITRSKMPKRSLTFDFGSIEAPTIPKARVVRPLRRNGPHKVAQRSRHCSAAEDSTGCQLKPKRFTRDELRSPLGPDDFTSSQDTKLDSGNASDTSLGSLLGQIEDQCVETDREDSPLWEEENEVIDASLLYNGSPSPSPSKRSFQRTWSDEKGKAVEIEEEDSTRRSKKRSREERSGDEADDEAEGKKMRYKRSRKLAVLCADPTPSLIEITKGVDSLVKVRGDSNMDIDAADAALVLDVLDDDEVDGEHDRKRMHKRSRKTILLSSDPTPSLVEITKGVDGLVSPGIDDHMDIDAADDALVAEVLASFFPNCIAPKQTSKFHRYEAYNRRCNAKFRSGPEMRPIAIPGDMFSPIAIKESQLYLVQSEKLDRIKEVRRRVTSRKYPQRLAGQHSTANLHRYSPTSLLPKREKATPRAHRLKDHSALPRLDAPAVCHVGQALTAIMSAEKVERHRRCALLARHRQRTIGGEWRKNIGTWWDFERVQASTKRFMAEWECLQGFVRKFGRWPADAVEICSFVNGPVSEQLGEKLNVGRKRSRSVESDDTEAVERMATRDVERLDEPQRSEICYQDPDMHHVEERLLPERSASEDAMTETETLLDADEVCETSVHVHSTAEGVFCEPELVESRDFHLDDAMSETSTSSIEVDVEVEVMVEEPDARIISPILGEFADPPEYEPPFHPFINTRPFLPRPPTTISIFPNSTPPVYRNDYRGNTPPPPPPYNASTDHETVIPAVFIEDDPEEEARLAIITPSGRSLSAFPSIEDEVEQAIVGAFPEPRSLQSVIHAPVPVRAGLERNVLAWNVAPDLEEGAQEDDGVEEEEEVEEDEQEAIGRGYGLMSLIGHVLRRW